MQLRWFSAIMTKRDIIVIGASTGGLEALSKLTSSLPADLAASMLVVVHTSLKSPMVFPEIVGRHSKLRMSYAAQGERPAHGHLYFASPDNHLTVAAQGFMMLHKGPKEHFTRPAANVLFRSAAASYGSRVIGIILTGGDGDGTEGFWAIKRAGGLCIVQEPREAEAPSMPMNAIEHDHPDYRVGLDDMADLVMKLVAGQT
jgi:two-component system chemotaxis response regulator CheB